MTSLPQRLRTETRALHRAAERSRFMRRLLAGRIERPAYCALLRNLHAIYAALEPALARHADHPALAPLALPGLARAPTLADDLRVLHGPDWAERLALQSAAGRYVARLHALDAARPERLLAHAYVRYLGDLSGGQLLAGVVGEALALSDGRGAAFYAFGDAAQTAALTRAFRDGLDRVVLDPPGVDGQVAEAVLAFELHRELFDELALRFP